MKWRALTRAEYWWQPAQLPRRAWRALAFRRRNLVTLTLPWGLPLTVSPRESMGRSMVALNTLDLPVTEAIWRLLDPQETAADVGANLGYMTSVMAARLRRGGTVHAFEPLPRLAARLRAHVQAWEAFGRPPIHVHEAAVADHEQTAELYVPEDWGENNGMATLRPTRGTTAVRVRCCRLDQVFANEKPPAVLKVDVEGCEADVFRGAAGLLRAGAVRDIIFEELRPVPSEVTALLQEYGYAVFRIARGFLRPRLTPLGEPVRGQLDVPSFLATRDPARAQARFRRLGWQSLNAS